MRSEWNKFHSFLRLTRRTPVGSVSHYLMIKLVWPRPPAPAFTLSHPLTFCTVLKYVWYMAACVCVCVVVVVPDFHWSAPGCGEENCNLIGYYAGARRISNHYALCISWHTVIHIPQVRLLCGGICKTAHTDNHICPTGTHTCAYYVLSTNTIFRCKLI